MSSQYTVMVILEAKTGKEAELEAALLAIVETSRSEKTNIEHRLHKSIDSPAQFILYENWESKEEHQEQLNKLYILELKAKLKLLLANYQAFFAQEI